MIYVSVVDSIMEKIVIKFSTIRGIHRTKVSSCEEVTLLVERDDSIPHIDKDCMKVMFPAAVPMHLLDNVTWPKNPDHKRYTDQRVRDCMGKKVGNVPANLARFFRRCLLHASTLTRITWYVLFYIE